MGSATSRRAMVTRHRRTAATAPDLVVGFVSAAVSADYRIYVHSRWLEPQAAAALFAAAHAPAKKLARRLADRSN